MTSPSDLPPHCGVAFKEWAGVCQALGDGRQSLILRKGGIDEGPGGFVPEHRAFWLYPTHLHEAQQGLKSEEYSPTAVSSLGFVPIQFLALVEAIRHIDRADLLSTLDEFHVWTEDTVRKRFHYRQPGLWALGVRVFRRPDAFELPVTPDHAGCKTWVPIEPALPTSALVPVIDEAEFGRRMDTLHSALGPHA